MPQRFGHSLIPDSTSGQAGSSRTENPDNGDETPLFKRSVSSTRHRKSSDISEMISPLASRENQTALRNDHGNDARSQNGRQQDSSSTTAIPIPPQLGRRTSTQRLTLKRAPSSSQTPRAKWRPHLRLIGRIKRHPFIAVTLFVFLIWLLFRFGTFILIRLLGGNPDPRIWLAAKRQQNRMSYWGKPAVRTDSTHQQKRKPLHARTGSSTRAPLPAGIILQTTSDHPVISDVLTVNMSSPFHPIYQLIRDSREMWDQKVARQSKTLKQAVEEYKRRNRGRLPPKGFDRWWNYVEENDVQLPDEYDQIQRDLHLYWALSPLELQKRVAALTSLPDTYTIQVRSGSVRTTTTFGAGQDVIEGAEDRLSGQLNLIASIVNDLEDFEAVYSVHDSAHNMLSHEHRAELVDHVEDGEYFGDNDEEPDLTHLGWSAACSPTSPFNTRHHTRENSSPGAITFISSSKATTDICNHPNQALLHGLIIGQRPPTTPLTPLFCLSKLAVHGDILGIPTEQWLKEPPYLPWNDKTNDRLLWRGSNTGIHFSQETPWRMSHRIRLVDLVKPKEEEVSVLSTSSPHTPLALRLAQFRAADASSHYFNISFAGNPIQCDEVDGTCQELERDFDFGQRISMEDALRHKYVIDVDGNAWSARFQRLMSSGSLVFKSTITPEWWTERSQPWVHYVPIQVDYSELRHSLNFVTTDCEKFRGDMISSRGEQQLARQIAEEGREWVKTHWRQEDMIAYVFRLYLEWARLLADNRKAMDFVYTEAADVL